MRNEIDLAVLGGGAAGFFAAISAAEKYPDKKIILFEKSSKILSKVKISGGGRCNVTHSCFNNSELIKNYPRGHKELIGPFHQFSVADTITWFKKNGVELVKEADGRMFPKSNTSQTIVDCFLEKAKALNIKIITNAKCKIQTSINGYELTIEELNLIYFSKKIIIACGGAPNLESYNWLNFSNCKIIPPVPSLFTFNIKDKELTKLMGISVKNAGVKIKEGNFGFNGPILITHWGFSGPAVLKTSAFAARWLNEKNYIYTIEIDWLTETKRELLFANLLDEKDKNGKKKIASINPNLPERLWKYLLTKIGINSEMILAEVPNKLLHKIVEVIKNDTYEAIGKTTFKEEFVTSGGIDLADINMKTMESKNQLGLFFAGEILNIDGVTGGFNFQAAWTTAYIAGNNCFEK